MKNTRHIEKGVQHKYVSRKKIKGRWVYVYPEKKGGKGRHDAGAKVSAKAFDGGFSVGDSFSAGAGKGHWHVKEIKDGQVSYKDDTTGEVKSLSVGDFKKTLLDAHKDAIQAHVSDGLKQREAVLEAAQKYGSDKQKARAEKLLGDWKKQHKDYLPKETESKGESASVEAKPSAPKVEIKLATLEGSEKQVTWAEDIRRKALEGASDFPAQLEDSITKLQQIYEDPSSEINTTNKAKKIQAYISLQLADDLRSVAMPILGEMAKQKNAKNWIEGRAALERFSNSTDGRVRMLASFFGSPSRDSFDIPEHAGAWEQLIPYGKPDPAFVEKNKPIEGVLEKLRGQDFAPVSDAWEKIEKLHKEPAPTGQTLKSLAAERKLLRDLHASILGQIGRGGGIKAVGALVDAFHGKSMPEAEYNEIKSNPEKAEQQLREKATILRGLFLLSHTNKTLQDAGRKLLEGVAVNETAKDAPIGASSEPSREGKK